MLGRIRGLQGWGLGGQAGSAGRLGAGRNCGSGWEDEGQAASVGGIEGAGRIHRSNEGGQVESMGGIGRMGVGAGGIHRTDWEDQGCR